MNIPARMTELSIALCDKLHIPLRWVLNLCALLDSPICICICF